MNNFKKTLSKDTKSDALWNAKEKRELFCKAVNSLLMRLPEGKMPEIEAILETAKKITDKVFENYPPPTSGEEEIPL